MATVVAWAVSAGEVRTDTDPELVIGLVTGPILSRLLFGGRQHRRHELPTIVTAALAGFRA